VVLHQSIENVQGMVNLRRHPTPHVSDECTNHLLAPEQVTISHILLAVFN